ncbi:hypothetical protein HHL28_17535 [Aerophototrophica crusticola]|uniref:Uncharacterized protein n=1 Tax=Aerophototrophica crusticola TaxID=1709002 RepID=A0A858RBU4_9PROT|nr:hypothetical protein HHL28_17535 [Rhodospirillaceae bacterium B3]
MAYLYDDSGFHDELPSREQVAARVERWKQRVADLFDRMESWMPEGFVADRDTTIPMSEPLMREVGVPTQRLPILTVTTPGGHVIRIVPRSLYTLYANSMVSVVGSKRAGRIVDAGSDDAPDWRVYLRDSLTTRTPLTREVFADILGAS